ncbi:hydrolase [Leptobacterium sp. I13]|uniref:hydrolase n=1 Tax=Leptobacterium meishanense TaxID=3128904 RepID=UPI0030ED005F
MRSRIFMYLFFFSVLFILFQYTNSRNYFKSKEKKIKALEDKVLKLKDSAQGLLLEKLDLQYFDLQNNDDALSYYDDMQIPDLSNYIRDRLLETNERSGNNPLIPYEGMTGQPMKINKIKVLNHKWIIADFSDGKHWGELFIKYEIKESKDIKFILLDHLLYPMYY